MWLTITILGSLHFEVTVPTPGFQFILTDNSDPNFTVQSIGAWIQYSEVYPPSLSFPPMANVNIKFVSLYSLCIRDSCWCVVAKSRKKADFVQTHREERGSARPTNEMTPAALMYLHGRYHLWETNRTLKLPPPGLVLTGSV